MKLLRYLGKSIDSIQVREWFNIIQKRHASFVQSEMKLAELTKSDLTNEELMNSKDINNFKAHEVRLINREIAFNVKLKEFISSED